MGKVVENINLAYQFFQVVNEAPLSPALMIENHLYSYEDLHLQASTLANYFIKQNLQRISILTRVNLDSYVGMLACHYAGVCYVPIRADEPMQRIEEMIKDSESQAIIGDIRQLTKFNENKFLLIAPNVKKNTDQKLVTLGCLKICTNFSPKPLKHSDLVYIRYTSGSTGQPKGVLITAQNLHWFMSTMKSYYQFSHVDKFANWASLSFDASVFEYSLAWFSGGCLYVIPEKEKMAPGHFIKKHAITVWYGIPNVINWMSKLNMLKENNFPSLRLSLFVGDVFRVDDAKKWQIAAPNSRIENLYGPTEATVSCSLYPVKPDGNSKNYKAIISIGQPIDAMEFIVVDDEFKPVPNGQPGELLIAGPQVSPGYWNRDKLNQEKFISKKFKTRKNSNWYRSGDLCYCDEEGDYFYIGRIDNQCKIHGVRVELEEIEYQCKIASLAEEVIVLAVPDSNNLGQDIIAFLVKPKRVAMEIKATLKTLLPSYLIPNKFIILDKLPYNQNGKVDRLTLANTV